MLLYHKCLTYSLISPSLPGQLQSEQLLFCCGFPAHEAGDTPGMARPCALQARDRSCRPRPHVCEQSLQGLQRDHLP